MNSSSHIKTQKLTGENWVKGRETIQFYKSGMKNGINVNISVIIKSSHYNNVFDFQSGKQHNKFNSFGSRIITYIVKQETKGKMCYTEYEVTRMLEVPVYNLFVEFGEHIFQTSAATTWEQTVNVLADLFPYSLESVYAIHFSKTLRHLRLVYIDDVLSIHNPNFANWIQLICLQRT
jgi:hypothetical protein